MQLHFNPIARTAAAAAAERWRRRRAVLQKLGRRRRSLSLSLFSGKIGRAPKLGR